MGVYLGNKIVNCVIVCLLLSSAWSYAQPLDVPVYNIDNKLWRTDSTRNYVMILKSHKSCEKCFAELNNYLQSTRFKNDIFCISIVDSSVFAKRSELKAVMKLMPGIREVLFNYYDNTNWAFSDNTTKTSIFSRYKIDITPGDTFYNPQ